MTNASKGLYSLYISLFTLILFANACEDPGNVGSGFIDEPTIKIDTLLLDDISTQSFSGYSGNLANFNIGQYSDQLFGDITAVGLIRPILYPFSPDTISPNRNNFSMGLEIQLDSSAVYGDTSSVTDFTVYEVTSLWRGNAHRVNEDLQYNEAEPLGSFTVDNTQKRFTIDLASSWKNKYAEYLNSDASNVDSLYRYEFFGLAIVPNNGSSKISIVDAIKSRFFMVDRRDDTISVDLSSRGYFLQRTNEPVGQNTTTKLYSTLEQMMKINIPVDFLKDTYQSENVLRVDLVLHEASQNLSGSLPQNHVRTQVTDLTMNLKADSEEVYQYQIIGPDYFALKNTNNPYYRAIITPYLNNVFFGGETNNEMLIGLRSNSGVLRSTSIYNQNAAQQLRPKLIITTVVNEEN